MNILCTEDHHHHRVAKSLHVNCFLNSSPFLERTYRAYIIISTHLVAPNGTGNLSRSHVLLLGTRWLLRGGNHICPFNGVFSRTEAF